MQLSWDLAHHVALNYEREHLGILECESRRPVQFEILLTLPIVPTTFARSDCSRELSTKSYLESDISIIRRRVTSLRWYHRAVISVVCILVAIDLILMLTSGDFLLDPDLGLFVTGIAILLIIIAIVVWLYRNVPYAEPETPSYPGEWADDGSRRIDSQLKGDVSRDITNVTLSGYCKDRRYFGGYDPRVNRPKKD